jgi:hypothetical protein
VLLFRAFFGWLGIIVAESLHGLLRNLVVAPAIGDFAARQVAVVTGSLLVLLIAWLTVPSIDPRDRKEALAVGLFWVALTVTFDLALGRLAGASWQRLLEEYDLPHGGLLPIGLAVMLLTPWVVLNLQRRLKS